MDMIRVLTASSLYELRSRIATDLAAVDYMQLLEPADSEIEAVAKLADPGADVLLIDVSLDENGFDAARRLRELYPALAIIMIDETVQGDTLHKAIMAGANDVLIYPFEPAHLNDAIVRSHKLMKSQEGSPRHNVRKSQKAQVLTVFSPKGGVGKTCTAINTAVSIYQQTKAEVALVDFDIDFGTVALSLNLQPRYVLSDILEDMRNINAETIDSYLTPHGSGVKVLPGNPLPALEEIVREDQVETIIMALRDAFDYVVIDMPSRFAMQLSPALRLADKVLLVTTPEISSLRNSKAALMVFENIGVQKDKVRVVLNRSDANQSIQARDVSRTLEREIYASLRDDARNLLLSQNEGRPLVSYAQKRGLIRDYQALAYKFLSESGRAPNLKKP